MRHSRLFSSLSFLILFLVTYIGGIAQPQDRAQLQTKMEALRAQIQAKEKVFLSASAEDLTAYAQFLSQPDTGMARLMPREKYDGKLLIRGGWRLLLIREAD